MLIAYFDVYSVKNNKVKILNQKKLTLFYKELINTTSSLGVRQNALCSLLEANKKLIEFQNRKNLFEGIILDEQTCDYIRVLVEEIKIKSEISTLSKILCE